MLPGLALLLLLGGAGLGVAVATLDDLLIQLQRLWLQVGVTHPDPDLTGTLHRLQTALDLVILALGSGCGVLGVGLWMRRSAQQERNVWQDRLTRLLTDSHDTRKTDLARLETLLTAQNETSREMARALSTQVETSQALTASLAAQHDISQTMAASLAAQKQTSQEMAAELVTIKESILRAEALAHTPPPPPVHAPPGNLLVPLSPLASAFGAHDPMPHPPARRLAIGGPETLHDKQDEEFEPF
ncbi:MAG: hypothetical protein HQL99_00590 [Magnetococcales bacterium]|nr:hypothetical protein [Magnetococcales bacterium]